MYYPHHRGRSTEYNTQCVSVTVCEKCVLVQDKCEYVCVCVSDPGIVLRDNGVTWSESENSKPSDQHPSWSNKNLNGKSTNRRWIWLCCSTSFNSSIFHAKWPLAYLESGSPSAWHFSSENEIQSRDKYARHSPSVQCVSQNAPRCSPTHYSPTFDFFFVSACGCQLIGRRACWTEIDVGLGLNWVKWIWHKTDLYLYEYMEMMIAPFFGSRLMASWFI